MWWLRLRLVLVIAGLTVAYYWLLIYLVGYASAQWPGSWWLTAFSSRHVAVVVWSEVSDTLAMIAAAVPLSIAAFYSLKSRALLGAAVAALAAAVYAAYPTLTPEIRPLVPASFVPFLIIDFFKMAALLPLCVWIVTKLPSNQRLERP